ncbi:uncharacterized protein LOC106159700 [Lingula anatina]|uniref:Uncharacterized protein LOC106159700 n=1 Tax=Lingula anatina TaxID=7574 RepID=A0A1S3HZU3_LINAN|nr:uncharacterized protein LOC106159700 [Lingula anatina]|eukprot:XP_013391533.1 uncharacterized protein LOC106159700 [Lingula anatina]
MAEGEVQDNIRKALFRSPAVDQAQSSGIILKMTDHQYILVSIIRMFLYDVTDTLMSKLQIEQDVETSVRILHKEQHEQTLKQLRQKLKDLTKDDWRYQPVNQLIGLE